MSTAIRVNIPVAHFTPACSASRPFVRDACRQVSTVPFDVSLSSNRANASRFGTVHARLGMSAVTESGRAMVPVPRIVRSVRDSGIVSSSKTHPRS